MSAQSTIPKRNILEKVKHHPWALHGISRGWRTFPNLASLSPKSKLPTIQATHTKGLENRLESRKVDDELRDWLKRLLNKQPLKRIILEKVKHQPIGAPWNQRRLAHDSKFGVTQFKKLIPAHTNHTKKKAWKGSRILAGRRRTPSLAKTFTQ